MKKIVLASLLMAGISITAQVKTPQASPSSKIEQVVGLTTVEVNYSRPSAKGRTVYGELVPYGKYWRTGANENTTVTFSENVMFGKSELKKGTYALFTLPKADSWDIIFYTDTNVRSQEISNAPESFVKLFNEIVNDSTGLFKVYGFTLTFNATFLSSHS